MSKKVMAMIMAAMLSISLAGCGSDNKTNNNTENTTVDTVEENQDTSGKWSKDFTLKDFNGTADDLIEKVEKQTKEYGLKYTEDEVVKDDNEKTVTVENEKADKNKLQNMYFSRITYGEDLSSGKLKMKLLLNFDGEGAVKDKKFDLGETSVATYAKILTGIDKRDYSDINAKILDILNSEDGEGYFTDSIEGLTEQVTVTKEYIVYSLETKEFEFKKAEQ